MDGKDKLKSPNLWMVLKFLTRIICFGGFVVNSFVIFKQFIGGKTLTSYDVQKSTKLYLPSLTICSLSGYKEPMDDYGDIELERFLRKTLDLGEIIESVDHTKITELHKGTKKWELTITYSQYKGTCHTIRYKNRVCNMFLRTCYQQNLNQGNVYSTMIMNTF